MKKNKTMYLVSVIITIAILHTISGCTAVMHDMVANSEESASKSLSQLEPVSVEQSRVILYMNRLSPGEMATSWAFGPGAFEEKYITIDSEHGSTNLSILDQTAEVIDLPPDRYAFVMKKKGILGKQISFSLNTEKGQTYFVKLHKDDPAEIIPAEQAREEISKAGIRCEIRDGSVLAITPNTTAEYMSYSSEMSHKQLTSLAMQFNPPPDRSRIYIIKVSSAPFGGNFLSGLDSKPTRKMKTNTFLCYEVAPGNHTVTFGHALNKSINEAYGINTAGGKCYFFEVIWARSNKQGFISEEKGKKYLEKCKLQENGFFKAIP